MRNASILRWSWLAFSPLERKYSDSRLAYIVLLTSQEFLILSKNVTTVERKNYPLTGRNLKQNLAQYKQPSAMKDWSFKKTEQIHKNNKRTDVGLLSMLKKVEISEKVTYLFSILSHCGIQTQILRSFLICTLKFDLIEIIFTVFVPLCYELYKEWAITLLWRTGFVRL